jgi:hypothetical protein
MHLAVFALNLAGFGLARPLQPIWRSQFKYQTAAAAPDRWCLLGVVDDDDTGRSPTGGERLDGQCQFEMALAGGARSGQRPVGGEVHQLHPTGTWRPLVSLTGSHLTPAVDTRSSRSLATPSSAVLLQDGPRFGGARLSPALLHNGDELQGCESSRALTRRSTVPLFVRDPIPRCYGNDRYSTNSSTFHITGRVATAP